MRIRVRRKASEDTVVFRGRPRRVVARWALAAWAVLGLGAVLTAADLALRADSESLSGSTEGEIAKVTARILEHSQFAHHPLDAKLAGQFLERYLDALDGNHMLFLLSDLEEFAPYRARLARLTRRDGDTTPAHVIFRRYLERLGQQADYVTWLLQTNSFDFTGPDFYNTDRAAAPRPRDLAAARLLWRERLRYEYLQEKLNGQSPARIAKALTQRYTRLLQMMNRFSSDEVLSLYLDALAHAYDPHSDYLSPEQWDTLSIEMDLSLSGIGTTLQWDDGYCHIRSLSPGGPAARSGQIQPNDRIVAVAQQDQPPTDIVDLPLSQAVELIRGPEGSTVTLTLIPAEAPDDSVRKTVTLVRERVRLEDERAKARLLDLPLPDHRTLRLGVIHLPSFYGEESSGGSEDTADASRDVSVLLRELQTLGVKGVVLDLRENGGGSLPEAIRLTGLFLRKGPIVQTREANGRIKVADDPDSSVVYDGPLIVLTSRFTASASEILTGALQDYGRALVVGDPSTFGKGTVQSLIPLERLMKRSARAQGCTPGAVKVTVSQFYRPDGASTQLKGVQADLVLPSLTDDPALTESALRNPLPWDQVPPVRHVNLDRVHPYLKALRENSAERVARDERFAYLNHELAESRKREAAPMVSLNEAIREREIKQSEADERSWEKKLAGLSTRSVPEYEITVGEAAQPGLPPALMRTDEQPALFSGHASGPGLQPNPPERLGDPILHEAERILADYVQLTAPAAERAHSTAPRPAAEHTASR